MFFTNDKTKPAPEALGLREQVAAWAGKLPPTWPSWARTSLVVAAMLVIGTLAVCLAPVILFTVVFTAVGFAHH